MSRRINLLLLPLPVGYHETYLYNDVIDTQIKKPKFPLNKLRLTPDLWHHQGSWNAYCTVRKMKFSIKDFFSKCD